MLPFRWKQWLTGASSIRGQRQTKQRRANPLVEALEVRLTPSHFRAGTVSWANVGGSPISTHHPTGRASHAR